jgi:glutamate synthase (ferredoxin)
MGHPHLPAAQGLYRPEHEHDSCGVGFVVHLKGHRSHKIVSDGLLALEHLNHRGASGSEVNTGDGAGILIQMPHEFFRRECAQLGIRLPEAGQYGAGLFFASRDVRARSQAMALFTALVEEEGQHMLGWREVPTNNSSLGATALEAEPAVYQAFVGRGASVVTKRQSTAGALRTPTGFIFPASPAGPSSIRECSRRSSCASTSPT